jgi:hypothetical protein
MAGRHTRNHDYVLTTRSAPGSPSRYSIVSDILLFYIRLLTGGFVINPEPLVT